MTSNTYSRGVRYCTCQAAGDTYRYPWDYGWHLPVPPGLWASVLPSKVPPSQPSARRPSRVWGQESLCLWGVHKGGHEWNIASNILLQLVTRYNVSRIIAIFQATATCCPKQTWVLFQIHCCCCYLLHRANMRHMIFATCNAILSRDKLKKYILPTC